MRLRGGTITKVNFETSLLRHYMINKSRHPTPDTNPCPELWVAELEKSSSKPVLCFSWFSLPLPSPRFYCITKASPEERGYRCPLLHQKLHGDPGLYNTPTTTLNELLQYGNFQSNLAALTHFISNLKPFKPCFLPTSEFNAPGCYNTSKQ